MGFDNLNIGLSVHDIIGGNTEHLNGYLNIYTDYLPQYVRYLPVMQQRAEKPIDLQATERWHQWLVLLKGRPIAMVGFLYNRKRNLGILMDFAIVKDARNLKVPGGGRLAGKLLNNAMEQLKEDAKTVGNSVPLCMAAEVEHTPLIGRYLEYGFVGFPIEYYEPPGTPELAKLLEPKDIERVGYRRLYLGAFQLPGNKYNLRDTQVVDIIVRALLEDHYKLPENHWLLIKTLESIQLGDALS